MGTIEGFGEHDANRNMDKADSDNIITTSFFFKTLLPLSYAKHQKYSRFGVSPVDKIESIDQISIFIFIFIIRI